MRTLTFWTLFRNALNGILKLDSHQMRPWGISGFLKAYHPRFLSIISECIILQHQNFLNQWGKQEINSSLKLICNNSSKTHLNLGKMIHKLNSIVVKLSHLKMMDHLSWEGAQAAVVTDFLLGERLRTCSSRVKLSNRGRVCKMLPNNSYSWRVKD